jgi:hypothetical protein
MLGVVSMFLGALSRKIWFYRRAMRRFLLWQ